MLGGDELSIALVGGRQTGKTCFARNAAGAGVQDLREALYLPTMGPLQHKIRVAKGGRGKSKAAVLWEVPTWLLAADAASFLSRGRHGIVFMVDCTRPETCENIISHWLHVARYCAHPESAFLLVGVKADTCPASIVEKLEARLMSLGLPHLFGSNFEEAFGAKVLKRLVDLQEVNYEHGSRPRGVALLEPLAPFRLPIQVTLLGAGVGLDDSPKVEPPKVEPSKLEIEEPEPPMRKTWIIEREELTFASELVDGPKSATWLGRKGKNTSRCGFLRGVKEVIVAKEVRSSDLLEQQELKRLLVLLTTHHSYDMVQLHGACLTVKPTIIVSEYMPGGDLEHYLRSRRTMQFRPWRPPTMLFFRWALGMARAVTFLHYGCGEQILHRHLKPWLLLLTTSLEVKVSSSCILTAPTHCAKPPEDPHSEPLKLDDCLYSAPEILKDDPEPYTDKADIFAMAMILWFMATGRRPLENLDNDGTRRPGFHVFKAFREDEDTSIHKRPQPPLQEMARGHTVRVLVEKAWSSSPDKRPNSQKFLSKLLDAEECSTSPQCCGTQ